jgi:hypothetical protein
MDVIAAASSAAQYGAWAYLVVFALMALSFARIPPAVLCASDGSDRRGYSST